jgi:hypothetical protein
MSQQLKNKLYLMSNVYSLFILRLQLLNDFLILHTCLA